MKCKIIIWVFVFFLLVGFAYAWEWDNVKEYDEATEKITIVNALGLGGILAEYRLLFNTDACIIDCYAEGTATLYDEDILFNDLRFRKKINGQLQYTSLTQSKYLIEINESYNHSIESTKKVCKDVMLANGTYQQCTYEDI